MIRRSTWIILGVFLVLVVAVLIWQRVQENQQAQITPTAAVSYFFDLGDKTIRGISITGPASQSVSATKNADGSWTLTEPSGQPAELEPDRRCRWVSLRVGSNYDFKSG